MADELRLSTFTPDYRDREVCPPHLFGLENCPPSEAEDVARALGLT